MGPCSQSLKMSGGFLCWMSALLSLLEPSFHYPCHGPCLCQERSRSVNCSGVNLTGPLSFPPETEHLDLSGGRLLEVPGPSLRFLWKLQVLLLGGNHISLVGEGAFGALESLRNLELQHNQISALGSGFSTGLGELRELSLAYNRLRELKAHSFRHFEELQELSLQNNAIASVQPGTFRSLTRLRRLYLQSNRLQHLQNGIFSMLQHLEVLDLEGNQIESIAPGVFTALKSLAVLNLAHNALGHIRFRTLLSIQTPSTYITLAHNPWVCDCDLQRVFGKLHRVPWLILDAYSNVTCLEPPVLQNLPLALVDTQLCTAETVTVLVITFTVCITVVAAVVMAERNRKKRTGKHWSEDSEMAYEAPE
ncbi:leucine-rich repeat-containing protein 15-like [Vombatus ursinus]|uniref:leucine-rich repeat-containing protein 15-like n=1 Tax=Vombatus ursinus TaxID=29139 RepID=UPI000FFD6206|nr:leucine-rich repeat-containing protein 15-like [Vombatus ursinus]